MMYIVKSVDTSFCKESQCGPDSTGFFGQQVDSIPSVPADGTDRQCRPSCESARPQGQADTARCRGNRYLSGAAGAVVTVMVLPVAVVVVDSATSTSLWVRLRYQSIARVCPAIAVDRTPARETLVNFKIHCLLFYRHLECGCRHSRSHTGNLCSNNWNGNRRMW